MDLANSIAKGVLTGALGLIGLRKTARAMTRGHTSAVTDISVDPSGTYLCSCDKEGNCKVWMVSYGYIVLQESLGESSCATCILATEPLQDVSSPDMDVLVFAAGHNETMKGVVCCWEASRDSGLWTGHSTSKKLFRFQGESGSITHLALLPGQRLAVSSVDGLIWIADLRMRTQKSSARDVVLPAQNFSSVTALLIVASRFPEHSKIVVGSETGRISVWNDDNLKPDPGEADFFFASPPKEIEIEEETSPKNYNLMSRAFSSSPHSSPTHQRSKRGQSFGFPTTSSRKHRKSSALYAHHRLDLHKQNPPMCEYWAHGKRALQGGGISTFEVTRWIDDDKRFLLFSASGDTTVKMWWLGQPELLATFRGHKAAVTKLAILRSDVEGSAPELYSASNDTTIMSWSVNAKEPEKCTCLRIFRGHDSIINDLIIIHIPQSAGEMQKHVAKTLSLGDKAPLIQGEDNVNLHYLITSSRDGTVRAWHLQQRHHGGKEKGYQVVHRGTSNLTKIVPHKTDALDIDAGKETHHLGSRGSKNSASPLAGDTNVIVACKSGKITYIDLFPSPQLKLNFRSASAYELCAPIIDWATFMYQKTRLVWPTVALCLAFLKIDEDDTQKHLHKEAAEKALEETHSRTGMYLSHLLSSYGLWSEEVCFIIEHIILVSVALMVVILMSCGVYHRLQKYYTHTMKAQDYIEEIATFTQTKARDLQPAHRKANFVLHCMELVYFFLWGTVKVLTVPILTHVYSAVDCPLMEDGKRYLSIDHNVVCWQGRHLYAASISVLIAAMYVGYVLPFTFVGSNISVFSDSESLEELQRNGAITACSVHLAFLTPIGLNWSYNQLTEFVVKATLPAVALLQNQHHVLRCAMMTALLALETLISVVWPAYSDPKASFLYSVLKFSLLYVSMCTLYGGYHADRLEAAPGLLMAIIIGSTIILVATVVRLLLPDKQYTSLGGNQNNFKSDSRQGTNSNLVAPEDSNV